MTPRRMVRAGLIGALWLVYGLLTSGCVSQPVYPAAPGAVPAATIHVVSHGWHSGIVIRRADITPGVWPEQRDFPHAEYLEIGWGDRDYYQARDPGWGTLLKAGLWPTASVLHVVGFRGAVGTHSPGSRVLGVPVSREGLEQLVVFIDRSHHRPDHTPLASLGPGLYGDSQYYPARGRFHLFNTCNRWTARALRAAGIDIDEVVTVSGLFAELERYLAASGNPLSPPHPPH